MPSSLVWGGRCVCEIFVFLRSGGTHERVCLYRLDDDHNPHSSALVARNGPSQSRNGSRNGSALLTDLDRFDASKAQCFLRSDRERLLAVIEAAFGDCTPFNKLVRGILYDAEQKNEDLYDA